MDPAESATAATAAQPPAALPLRAFELVAAGSVFVYLLGPWRTDVSDFLVLGAAAAVLWALRARLLPAPPVLRADRAAALVLFGFSALAAVGLCAWGLAWRGHPFRPLGTGTTFLLYLPFAAIQQYLTQRYLTGRICSGLCRGSTPWTALLAGVLFGCCHAPWPPIHAVTTVAGVVWAWCWLRTGRVWGIVLSHALLATLLFNVAWGFDTLRILRWELGW